MNLVGFINPFGAEPALLTPVYEDPEAGGYFYQRSDLLGSPAPIVDFVPADDLCLKETPLVASPQAPFSRAIGEEAIVALGVDGDFLWSARSQFADAFFSSGMYVGMRENPFLLIEVLSLVSEGAPEDVSALLRESIERLPPRIRALAESGLSVATNHVTLGPNVQWSPCEPDTTETLSKWIQARTSASVSASRISSVMTGSLAFYRNHRLFELGVQSALGGDRMFMLWGAHDAYPLDGDARNIHEVNRLEGLSLRRAQVLDYLRFFLFFLRGSEGPFILVESARHARVGARWGSVLASKIRPLHLLPSSEDEATFHCEATIAYGRQLFHANLEIESNGSTTMVDDTEVADLTDLELPRYAELSSGWRNLEIMSAATAAQQASTARSEEPTTDWSTTRQFTYFSARG